jgi:hypothetical protein
MKAASCGARQYADTGGVEEGQSSVHVLSSEKSILFRTTKEKQLFSWLVEKIVITRLIREKWQDVQVDMGKER